MQVSCNASDSPPSFSLAYHLFVDLWMSLFSPLFSAAITASNAVFVFFYIDKSVVP